jgi:hypothetical protein
MLERQMPLKVPRTSYLQSTVFNELNVKDWIVCMSATSTVNESAGMSVYQKREEGCENENNPGGLRYIDIKRSIMALKLIKHTYGFDHGGYADEGT